MTDRQKDNVALMCDVAERAGLFEYESGLESFLQRVVSTIAWHMRAAVCSIYLYDPGTHALVLRANQGLNPELVGKAQLKYGEGIVGNALKLMKPIRAPHATQSPYYKHIPGLDQDRFLSFLAVPIIRKSQPVGVIVVQDPEWNYFTENDQQALQVISSQLSGIIGNARILLSMHEGKTLEASPVVEALQDAPLLSGTHIVYGRGGGVGHAFGASMRIGHYLEDLAKEEAGRHHGLTEADFDRAMALTEKQLLELQQRLEDRLRDSAALIFDAHVLMLKDDAFSGQIRKNIRTGLNPWAAVVQEVKHYSEMFANSRDPSFREKVLDIEDLGRRLLHNLQPDAANSPALDYHGSIIIAEQVLPSDLLKLSMEGAAGLILLAGGQTAHVAILARALHLPLVIADNQQLLHLPEHTPILINAQEDYVIIRPDEATVKHLQDLQAAAAALEKRGAEHPHEETRTRDGTPICLNANLNLLAEMNYADHAHADGIGLYRTEFPFIIGSTFPTEEEQYHGYCRVIEHMKGRDVVFRTLDIGGDKALSYFPFQHENNPFLGLRALRFTLRNPEIFRRQLRALLRAAALAEGHARIMFPLVASVDEFLDARNIALSCAEELRNEGKPHAVPPIGLMVELPSAVLLVEELAKVADFLSIGSNDLVQYVLAVDRTNQEMATWYAPHHPAILRSIKTIVDAAKAENKEVSLCGDMAADARFIPFLLGIGMRTLSMDAQFLFATRKIISSLTIEEAGHIAEEMLQLTRTQEVAEYLAKRFPAP